VECAPLQEFGRVVEPEGGVIVFNVVCRQEFVHLFQLDSAGLVGLRGIRTPAYLSGVVDIQRRPFKILGEGVWLLLELFERLWGLDVAILLGRSLA
jgi:hypothetical protein